MNIIHLSTVKPSVSFEKQNMNSKTALSINYRKQFSLAIRGIRERNGTHFHMYFSVCPGHLEATQFRRWHNIADLCNALRAAYVFC